MTIEIIGYITLAVCIYGLFCQPAFLVYVYFGASLLGSAAAFILTSLGGTSVSPAHLILGFLTIKLLGDRDIRKKAFEGIGIGRPGFWLLLTIIYSVLSAYFMPIFFAGQMFVFPVRIVANAYTAVLVPAVSNLTQSIYLIGDFVCFFVLYGYATDENRVMTLSNAVIVTAVLDLVFVVLDVATFATGTADLLAFIRNATYAILNDNEVAGFKRIVGSFNEASAFGAVTLGYFAFTLQLWLSGVRPHLTFTLTMLLLGALVCSTSTTAYVGLAVFLGFVYLGILVRMAQRSLTRQMAYFAFGIPIVLLIVIFAILLNEALSAYIYSLASELILNKLSTESGIERSAWNRQAIQVFFDTYGFGVGNGSLRASSFPIAVLGSLGFIGTTLFALFFVGLFFQKDNGYDPTVSVIRRAARFACLATLITVTISGALTDIGLSFYLFAAVACCAPARSRGRIRAEYVFSRPERAPIHVADWPTRSRA